MNKPAVLLGATLVCGIAVYLGEMDQPVSLTSARELWSDALRDVDESALRLARVSDREEMDVGARLSAALNLTDEAAWVPRVDAIGHQVALGAARKEIRYRFHPVALAAVNAFSLPGGEIYITTPMLATLGSDDELAAVLAHEIAHVDLRHCIGRHQYSVKMRHTGALADFARTLVTAQYGQSQEYEADEVGARMAERAGYDPEALARVLGRMPHPAAQAAPATPMSEAARALGTTLGSWWYSHPGPEERARRLKTPNRVAKPR